MDLAKDEISQCLIHRERYHSYVPDIAADLFHQFATIILRSQVEWIQTVQISTTLTITEEVKIDLSERILSEC